MDSVSWDYWFAQEYWPLPQAIALLYSYELRGGNERDYLDFSRNYCPPKQPTWMALDIYQDLTSTYFKAITRIKEENEKSDKDRIFCFRNNPEQLFRREVSVKSFINWILIEQIKYPDILAPLITSVGKSLKPRNSALDKAKAREYARSFFKDNPHATIASVVLLMKQNNDFNMYTARTLRDWITDCAPNRKRGRPKSVNH